MRKKRKSGSSSTLKVAGEALIGAGIAVVLMGAMVGIFYAGKYAYEVGHEYFTRKEPTKTPSPGELVDKAMAIPGAFVIGPRRDLEEMGLVTDGSLPKHVGGPAIAIHTKGGWCVWSLGGSALEPKPLDGDKGLWAVSYGQVKTENAHFIGPNMIGFEGAYDAFRKCISAGNTIDPIKHHGAKCDGKHDDTKAIRASVREARQLPMGSVKMPDGCRVTTVSFAGGKMVDG